MPIRRLILVGLLLLCNAGSVLAEDPVAAQLKLLEKSQRELTEAQIKAYKAEVANKVSAIDNRVSLKLGLWGLGVFAIGALVGLGVGLKWKSREVEKIIAKEADDFREKIRRDVLEVFASEDEELQNGLDTSIQKSIERVQHERRSSVLVVTGEADHELQEVLPRLGFDEGNFLSMRIEQVFDYRNGATVPADQDFELVILDSLSQEDAYHYIKAGRHHGYLLYKDGRYETVIKDESGVEKAHPFKIPSDRIIIANSKPTVYGHVMTLLSFNKGS